MMTMKSFISDIIGIAGYGCTIAGIYLQWGFPVALMCGGSSAFVLVIAKQWGGD